MDIPPARETESRGRENARGHVDSRQQHLNSLCSCRLCRQLAVGNPQPSQGNRCAARYMRRSGNTRSLLERLKDSNLKRRTRSNRSFVGIVGWRMNSWVRLAIGASFRFSCTRQSVNLLRGTAVCVSRPIEVSHEQTSGGYSSYFAYVCIQQPPLLTAVTREKHASFSRDFCTPFVLPRSPTREAPAFHPSER